MVDIKELKRWLGTLDPENDVGIDEGGLTLHELDEDGKETGAYLEIGGYGGGEMDPEEE